jgi:DNA-binding LytR/AlgR family response regulator
MSKILVLEDDLLDKFILTQLLSQIGYHDIISTPSPNKIKPLIQKHEPDLLIMDVFYEGGNNIDLVLDSYIASYPILFITVSKEIDIYESIKDNHRFGFLTKPLEPVSLRSTINMLLNRPKQIDILQNPEDAFFLRQGNKQLRILFADILWLEADDNYTFIFTLTAKYVIKKPLKHTIAELDGRFVQTHKKYCVNLDFVITIKIKSVLVQAQEVPLSYFYKKEFMSKLHILRNAKAPKYEVH